MPSSNRHSPAEIDLYRRAVVGMRQGRRLLFEAVASSPTGVVVLLDLDDMERINRRFGTRVGDRLLAAIDSALKAVTAGRGGAVHLGGDQFLAVVTRVRRPEPVVQDLVMACGRTRVRLARVTASAGMCVWSESRAQPHELLATAGSSLERAKLAVHTHGRVASPLTFRWWTGE